MIQNNAGPLNSEYQSPVRAECPMEHHDAARETAANAAVTTCDLADDLGDRRLSIVAIRPLNIDRRMQ